MFVTPKESGRTSILAKSGRKSQQTTPNAIAARTENVLDEGDGYVVKALNSPVPVQVQEALRAESKVAGVKLHKSGWALLVADAKVFIWRYSTHQLSTKCYLVNLPGSSTGWNAELVTFLSGTSESKVSLMGCSPEGCVSWWSDVLRSRSTTLQTSIDVGEGYVFSVNSLPVLEESCLVVTSLASLWVVSAPASVESSESGLSLHSLASSHGVFSGLGRRVSSIFFGSQNSEVEEARRVTVYQNDVSKVTALVLTSTNIKRWQITPDIDEFVSDVNVISILKDIVMVAGWVDPTISPTIWLIDMQIAMNQMALLFAVSENSNAEHGIAVFPATSDPSPSNLKHLIRLNHRMPVGNVSMVTSFTLHGIDVSSSILMLSKNAVLLANVTDGSSLNDVISFPRSNYILGVGQLSAHLLIFTLAHGVVSITQTFMDTSDQRLSTPIVSTSTAKTSSKKLALSLVTEETTAESVEMMENAFSQYLEGDIAGAVSMCDQHFPVSSFSHGVDTPGDLAIVQLSKLILDDPPPQVDPSMNEGLGLADSQEPKSMIVIYRLEQKIEAHNRYVQFLINVGLMDKMSCVRHCKRILPTQLLLREHGELLQAAITLRKMHNQVVNDVIDIILGNRPSSLFSLSKTNSFYTNISMFEEFFPALICYQNDVLKSMDNPNEKVNLLLSASTLLDSMLRNILFCRQSTAGIYKTCTSASDELINDSFPWTASDGMRNTIAEQLDLLFLIGIAEVQNNQDQHLLWNIIVSLMDILYEGYKSQLESLKSSTFSKEKHNEMKKNFQVYRKKFLNLLLEHGQLSPASELAERYQDFGILVTLCQGIGNTAKLKEYMTRFSEQGFSEFLFKQYLEDGQLKQLLSFSEDFPAELGKFLEPHPSLSWLHQFAIHDYSKAHVMLKELADQETEYVGRKKTLLSLSKLSLLASSHPEEAKSDQLHDLNFLLQHIAVQHELPNEVVKAAGLDYDLMPPLSPQKIIKLYVGEHNPNSDEKQFLLALDYLNISSANTDKSEVEQLRTYIWTQAVLKDDWTQLSTSDPLVELQKTFFFRVVDEAFHQEWDLLQALPEMNSLLTCPSLVETGLHQDHTFCYLMKAGYEQTARVQKHTF